jgi:translation initiation factor IF-2
MVGWDKIPTVGSPFSVFLKKAEAEEYAQEEAGKIESDVNETNIPEGAIFLPIIVKADAAGSLEAIVSEIKKLGKERIVPKIILSGIGTVSESDIRYGQSTPNLVVIGFNTKVDSQATALLERLGIPLLTFNIIYELTDKIKELLVEREPRIQVEEIKGSAKVLKIFSTAKDKHVLGARVNTGEIVNGALVKIIRRESEIGRGKIKELQQSKVKVESVLEGTEFGAQVESKIEIAPGDVLEAVVTVTK